MIYHEPRFLNAGDKALSVEFGDEISPELNQKVRNLMLAIGKAGIRGIAETVPAYRSLLVCFDPRQIAHDALQEELRTLLRLPMDREVPQPRTVAVPVAYGGQYGPDLEYVATYHHLSPSEVVRVHCDTPYLVYMLGFMPGFPYLGGMSLDIATPRLATPRTSIAAGSVGIAGDQTGIYPMESPGGWRIIGRTPVRVFDSNREPPSLFRAGDRVVFRSISPPEFERLKEAAADRHPPQ
jgi:KipI family sensor histidine kinase inhibitor